MSIFFGNEAHGRFEYAAPPCTGNEWFVEACLSTGIECHVAEQFVARSVEPFVPFAEHGDSSILRISVVRHPCTWLASAYATRLDDHGLHPSRFKSLRDFVTAYLNESPGLVSQIFNSYEADSRMRLEDAPWALYNFLISLGIPRWRAAHLFAKLKRVECIDLLSPSEDLHRRIVEAESDFCESLEYY